MNARLSDTNKYVCVVSNEAGEARKTFDLSVLGESTPQATHIRCFPVSEKPRFRDMTNLNPSIVVGRPLVLDCTVTGTPKPTITWLKVREEAEDGQE